MNAVAPRAYAARPQDVDIWLMLRALAQQQPVPSDTADQVTLFLSASDAENRIICWLDKQPIACWIFAPLDESIEIRDFFIVPAYLAPYGEQILAEAISLARTRARLLTIYRYSADYCDLVVKAGFFQNTRIKMMRLLTTYQIEIAAVPASLHLRSPHLTDEANMAELTYRNYLGTVDEGMVSQSPAQVAAMVHDIFGEQYCLFDRDCSFVVEDARGELVGNIFVGYQSLQELERLMWIMDISVSPNWRGKGLGRALLVSGMNAARMKGYFSIGLTVTLSNLPARQLYRSLGFQPYGEYLYEAFLPL